MPNKYKFKKIDSSESSPSEVAKSFTSVEVADIIVDQNHLNDLKFETLVNVTFNLYKNGVLSGSPVRTAILNDKRLNKVNSVNQNEIDNAVDTLLDSITAEYLI